MEYYYVLPQKKNDDCEKMYIIKAKNKKQLSDLGFNAKAVVKRSSSYEEASKGINPKNIKFWG